MPPEVNHPVVGKSHPIDCRVPRVAGLFSRIVSDDLSNLAVLAVQAFVVGIGFVRDVDPDAVTKGESPAHYLHLGTPALINPNYINLINLTMPDLPSDVDADAIEELVDRYQSLDEYERRQKDEAEVRQQFLNPLLRALGWDTTTDQVMPEQRTLTGHADYALSLNGRERFFMEAKRFSADLDGERTIRSDEKQSYKEQAIDYAWHQGCDWAVLTNFGELRLYWTHVNKDSIDDGLAFKLTADEFLTDDGLEKLATLSKGAIEGGSLERLERNHRRDRKPVTEAVLDTLSDARLSLTKDVHESEDLELDELREGVQRILDRLVIIRVAEDRGVISPGTLKQTVDRWDSTKMGSRPLFGDLKLIFREFHDVYNSGLFASHDAEDWDIPDDTIKEVIEELDEYKFEYLNADILGTIYEGYLAHEVEETASGEVKLVEQQGDREEEGIYYTPVPVVRYTVNSVLGDKLDNLIDDVREELEKDDPDFAAAKETFQRIESIRFLDVSCGSGTFLINAYDEFVRAYKEYNSLLDEYRPDNPGLGEWEDMSTVPEQTYKSDILENNIFAVDLDPQATEIASVNLFLKALTKNMSVPELIGENLKVGNSLLDGSASEVADVLGVDEDEAEAMGAFDWESEFDDVFEDGGFDVICGNPPWGADIDSYRDWIDHDDNYQLATGQYDSHDLFIELTSKLLGEDGSLGFIVPDTLFEEDHSNVREWLVDNYELNQVHKLGEGVFPDVYSPAAILQYTVREPTDDHELICSVLRKEDREAMRGSKGEALATLIDDRKNITKQKRFKERGYAFTVFAGEEDYDIMETMEEDTVDARDALQDGRGDEIGKSGEVMRCPSCMEWDTYPRPRAASKGGGYYPKTCSHCDHEYEFEDAAETRKIIREAQPDDSWKKLYFGEHVTRYRETGHAYIDDSVSGIDLEDDEWFDPPKILLRKTGFGFNARVDYTDARCLQVVYIFRKQDDLDEPYSNYDLEYFLGLINSRVMLYYHTKRVSEIEWESYPYKTQGLIMDDLPYPEIDWEDDEEVERYNTFVEKVREALDDDGKIDNDLDWEIERLAIELYGIEPENRSRIWSELDELQRLQVVRELFPDEDDEGAEDETAVAEAEA